jgi:glutamate racemase
MLTADMPIGVLDSGVGGLSVLKCLRTMLPAEDFIYLGDTARTPYGPRSEQEVRAFVEQMLCFFDEKKVKLVVVACNTLTVLGVETLKRQHKFDIIGMSKGAALVLAASKKKNIGVFATEFTIGTGAHKDAILEIDPTASVAPIACPKFVPLIEGEQFGSADLSDAIIEYTDKLKAVGADTLILSCTHYPFIRREIEKALGDGVHVIDPAEETAKNTIDLLEGQRLAKGTGQGSTVIYFTADLDRGMRLAKHMLPNTRSIFAQINLK